MVKHVYPDNLIVQITQQKQGCIKKPAGIKGVGHLEMKIGLSKLSKKWIWNLLCVLTEDR
jgi:hypothetical protein